MSTYNFKKEWPKIKKQFSRLSQEALVLAKKGEKELRDLSAKGKLGVEVAALAVKREHLCLLIGKACVQKPCACLKSDKVQKMLDEVSRIDQETKILRRKMKSSARKAK